MKVKITLSYNELDALFTCIQAQVHHSNRFKLTDMDSAQDILESVVMTRLYKRLRNKIESQRQNKYKITLPPDEAALFWLYYSPSADNRTTFEQLTTSKVVDEIHQQMQ